MKWLLKRLAARVEIDAYQRPMVYAILRNTFSELASCPTYDRREDLWNECVQAYGGAIKRISFVEFGVHEGHSIRSFAASNRNDNSIFIGLDSFEGLPEPWGEYPRGHFDTGGAIPIIDDPRVKFVPGWFQDTRHLLYAELTLRDNLVVHYDADLYSSTLFALTEIDVLGTAYLAVFDEFAGHETRALYDYLQSHQASVAFLGKTLTGGYPDQVLCRISPRIAGGRGLADATRG